MSVETSQSPNMETPVSLPLEPVNILLVDDEVGNLKALDAVLAADDRRLMWAQSGEDALRWLLRERFAVVLLDVHMPDMDGFETAELMRQHVRSESTPIIFLTAANKESAHVSRGYALGAVDYIFKPLDVSILRSKVAVFVELFRKTEQVRRQAELLTEARGFLQNVLESTTDYAIIAQDLAGTIMAWYEGARLHYGYTAEEVVGKESVHTLFAPEEGGSSRIKDTFDAALRDGRAEGVFQHVHQDGQRFTASVSVNVWRDAGGDVIGYVLVVKDITEQQVQEERARLLIKEQAARAEAEAANRRFALLAEASAELSGLLEGGSTLETVARLMLEDLAQACIVDLLTDEGEMRRVAVSHHEPERERQLRALPAPDPRAPLLSRALVGEPVLLSKLSRHTLQELVPDAGQRRVFSSFGFTSVMILPIPGREAAPPPQSGGVLGAIWLFSSGPDPYGGSDLEFAADLARRIGLALDNVWLYQQAQQAVHMREEFLSVAAHELKTPVTSLHAQAQLMIRKLATGHEVEPERLERAFRVIDGQTQRLSHLVSQLLDVSRLQGGKLALERSSADVTELVEGAVARAQATTTLHSIELEAPGPVVADIDVLRLEQVVTNLLDNAIKYSPEGGRVQVEVAQPSPEAVRLTVRDWGVGIPPEHRPYIFNRFHQVVADHHSSGMGLGLYISRQIVELHGGEIEAQFPEDGGTRFVVTVPAVTEEPAVSP